MDMKVHQSLLVPADNKFHVGNGDDGKHYWLSPWQDPVFVAINEKYGPFDFDPCPYPLPPGFDGLTCEWGQRNYVNPPFGSIMHQGPNDKKPKKKGPTAWMRKAIEEQHKGKFSFVVYPIDKWVLMMLEACDCNAKVINLRDVRWLATEDGSIGKGTGRHIAGFVLEPKRSVPALAVATEHVFAGIHASDRFTAEAAHEAFADVRYELTPAGKAHLEGKS